MIDHQMIIQPLNAKAKIIGRSRNTIKYFGDLDLLSCNGTERNYSISSLIFHKTNGMEDSLKNLIETDHKETSRMRFHSTRMNNNQDNLARPWNNAQKKNNPKNEGKVVKLKACNKRTISLNMNFNGKSSLEAPRLQQFKPVTERLSNILKIKGNNRRKADSLVLFNPERENYQAKPYANTNKNVIPNMPCIPKLRLNSNIFVGVKNKGLIEKLKSLHPNKKLINQIYFKIEHIKSKC